MAYKHTFDDGTEVELDDDVTPEQVLTADADDISEDDYAALVAQAEAAHANDDDLPDDDTEPAGGAG